MCSRVENSQIYTQTFDTLLSAGVTAFLREWGQFSVPSEKTVLSVDAARLMEKPGESSGVYKPQCCQADFAKTMRGIIP
jgi:hypothetical protein